MKTFIPKETNLQQLHKLLLGSVAPRPIALASTMDKDGNPNLSPFSFFNVFGVNPPTLIFSPSRRGRDNSTKDTFENVKQHQEVVINVVNFAMVEQTNLSSNEYPSGINEFEKAGFTPIASDEVKPFRVKESPVHFECLVKEVVETSQLPGAGNLVICEILKIHVDENVLIDTGGVDQDKIDLVGRLGGDLYCRTKVAKFRIEKPGLMPGEGIDALPEAVRNSDVLTGNHLGKLGGLQSLPGEKEIKKVIAQKEIAEFLSQAENNRKSVHQFAKKLIEDGKITEAFCVLISV